MQVLTAANQLTLGTGSGAAFDGLNDTNPHEVVMTLTRVGDGAVTRYKQGESFYEPTNAVHADTRNPSESSTAKILAVMIAKEGEPSLQLAH